MTLQRLAALPPASLASILPKNPMPILGKYSSEGTYPKQKPSTFHVPADQVLEGKVA